jgi:hypothetical protein
MESFFLISILLAKDVEEEKKLRGGKRGRACIRIENLGGRENSIS